MEFKLPSVEAKATIEFFDADSVCIGQIEKMPQSNRKGRAFIVLEPDDIPAGSKQAQLVFEYEGKIGRSQMRRIQSPASPNAITPAASQQNQTTSKDALEFVKAFETVVKLWPEIRAMQAEKELAVGQQAERLPLYELMTDEERQSYIDQLWRQGTLKVLHMSQQELVDWKAAQARNHQKLDNWIWNWENHGHFIRGIKQFTYLLSENENQAVETLLRNQRWGDAELKQVKGIVEAAQRLTDEQNATQVTGKGASIFVVAET